MSQEFTDHYTILDEGLFPTRAAALTAANQDTERVWFVRHGDDDGDAACEQCGNTDQDGSYQCPDCGGTMVDPEPVWDVQQDFGQFVNCVGFFVTVERCKSEHVDEIFTY